VSTYAIGQAILVSTPWEPRVGTPATIVWVGKKFLHVFRIVRQKKAKVLYSQVVG
jgi:hypothetical protein